MWRPPLGVPSSPMRSGGVLAVLVRFEPVRSAEPPSISGSALVKASSAIWLALREADVLGLAVRGDDRIDGGLRKVLRQLALQPPRQLGGQRRDARPCTTAKRALHAASASMPAALAVPGAVGRLGNDEGLVRPADRRARGLDLVGAERLAMRLGGAAAVGRAAADGGAGDDQRRSARCFLRLPDRRIDGGHVMAVDGADDVPAVGLEALGRVVDEPGLDAAVDA